MLVYGGIFFLGFGGSRWTSDMAINFFKTVLSTVRSLCHGPIIGIGKSILDSYYTGMSSSISLKEMGVICCSIGSSLFEQQNPGFNCGTCRR
ncbi:type IV secretion system protein [Klebsiella quasipneumoniae]|uniref:type IV secretion system protein n=1 Tax=Klebsiella quasipneumoniae TaxID=1463165 RepID=UPI0038903F27